MRALIGRLSSAVVAVAVVAALGAATGCCCPCAYVGGVPDVAQQIRPELPAPSMTAEHTRRD